MIYLRGHHLRLLRGYVLAGRSDESLQRKKEAIIKNSINDGHGRLHGLNIIETLEGILYSNEKVKLIDTVDDICETCDRVDDVRCNMFVPNDVSATSDDRGELYFYGLQRRVYTVKYVMKKLFEK